MPDLATWRVIDANANRAGEGLRTLEDVARLVREDAVAAKWIKSLRHEFANTVSQLDRSARLTSRCTEDDAGTALTTVEEGSRQDWQDIVIAASERIGQSLRSLEEFSKLIDRGVSAQFKQLRYSAYDVLAKFELRLLRKNPLSDARLYVLLDCGLPIDGFVNYVRELAQAGADVLQLRDKDREGGELVKYARAAVTTLNQSSTWLIVNDRVDVAIASGAAGVHLGQEDIQLEDIRSLNSQLWIGISTHNIAQALAAEQRGADYIGCGPTFHSPTKSFAEFPGVALIREVAEQISIPAFAIGGITLENLDAVLRTGCHRVAVSSAIHRSSQPLEATHDFKRRLDAATSKTT